MASFSSLRTDVFSREQRRQHYGSHVMGLNAYDRHKKFMDDYVNHYGRLATPGSPKLVKTDMDTLRETYRFIRTEEDDESRTWEQRLAKRYYDKLFKEYCIADMSRYKESKIGLRWRSEKEVLSGKGQFICGNKTCNETEGLRSYEVNFAYKESGESRQALVKLRVCPRCAYKLNYRKEQELERKLAKQQEKLVKRRRERKSHGSPKRPRLRRKSDEDSEGEDWSSSGGEDSETSEERLHVDAGKSRALSPESRDPKSVTGTAAVSDSQPPDQNEEFDQFFEGMFL